jgi:predicted phosphodiesterase
VKILILADIHANLAALQAVFEAEGSWDEILFLGDAVGWGPNPEEVLSLLSEQHGIFVMGNHDWNVLRADRTESNGTSDALWMKWSRDQISSRNLEFLSSFSPPCVVARQGLTMRLIHGDGIHGEKDRLWPDSPPELFMALKTRYDEPHILISHTHVQFERNFKGTHFMNPGGLGQPRLGQVVAGYGVLENGRIRLKAVPYDAEKTANGMDNIPLEKAFIQTWKSSFRQGTVPGFYSIRDFSPLVKMGLR